MSNVFDRDGNLIPESADNPRLRQARQDAIERHTPGEAYELDDCNPIEVLFEIVKPNQPLVQGGQGRGGHDLIRSASVISHLAAAGSGAVIVLLFF